MGYICIGGEGDGVSVIRETSGQFGTLEGAGAVGPGKLAVGRRS